MNTQTARIPVPASPTGAVYEMRLLRTDAERDEAAALVTDRLNWLARKHLTVPGGQGVPKFFRDAQNLPLGLFDDGVLICCLILNREPDLRHWGTAGDGPTLSLRHVYTLPGHAGIGIARRLTLWASDYAVRTDRPWVRLEALLARDTLLAEPVTHIFSCVRSLGWTSAGNGPGTNGARAVNLQMPAELRPSLPEVIRCTVPLNFEWNA
ncbi:hypothetical protein [Streptomyces sp. NPDC002520]